MYPLWQGRGPSRGPSEDHGGASQRTWLKDADDKRKGWMRDPNGVWIRDSTVNGYSPINGTPNGLSGKMVTPLNKANSSLWNRRRTNSVNSIPTLSSSTPPGNQPSAREQSPSPSSGSPSVVIPTGLQRGSSASPRMPHTKGFWVQEPDELQQVWVGTETPDTETPSTSGILSSARYPSQPPSPHRTPQTGLPSVPKVPQPGNANTTAPKVYKSHATWVSRRLRLL